mmetsp:Transcript_33974/g.60069  ORF Transcript_33974/g.60069 Transcript_33974/m.60069 type:complete len:208 (+) Transcript_33974:197-820(+)
MAESFHHHFQLFCFNRSGTVQITSFESFLRLGFHLGVKIRCSCLCWWLGWSCLSGWSWLRWSWLGWCRFGWSRLNWCRFGRCCLCCWWCFFSCWCCLSRRCFLSGWCCLSWSCLHRRWCHLHNWRTLGHRCRRRGGLLRWAGRLDFLDHFLQLLPLLLRQLGHQILELLGGHLGGGRCDTGRLTSAHDVKTLQSALAARRSAGKLCP